MMRNSKKGYYVLRGVLTGPQGIDQLAMPIELPLPAAITTPS